MVELSDGWLYEAGIGENRAMLIVRGECVQIRVERESAAAQAGAVVDAKFVSQWVAGRSGIIALESGQECLLQPLPKGLTEGALVRVEIVREALYEAGGKSKRAKAKPAAEEALPRNAPTLSERLDTGSLPVKQVLAHDPDWLGDYGWHEMLEQAETGNVGFSGGNLLISLTPAMTVIDIDGPLGAFELAKRAAKAVAAALNRFDITGNVGVDFPTLEAKADRNAVMAFFDEAMAKNYAMKHERTAINGFGFMQVISRKSRPSVLEIMQADKSLNAALTLLRTAGRDRGTGAMQLTMHPAVAAKLKPAWLEELTKRAGRAVSVDVKGEIAIEAGQISAA